MRSPLLQLLMFLLLSLTGTAAGDLVFHLPTDNKSLYDKGGDSYFMYVDRTFEGKTTKPWEGGTWGLVRNPFRASNGNVYYSRMHEGIDVKPILRDENNEPQDDVRPIAHGQVAYTCEDPRKSNYGRYIVIAHKIKEGTVYSLYAHMASVTCQVGQRVTPQDTIGRLGYSGVGLNKTRAHCHLELCLMINADYDLIDQPPSNKHGVFNGQNLIGINVADVLRACKNGKPFSLSRYFSRQKEHYRVRVPCIGIMDFLKRYPFLYKGRRDRRPTSLEIAFTKEGVPIAIYSSKEKVDAPILVKCTPMPFLQQNCTVNRVKGSSQDATLTASGMRYVNNFLWLEGRYPVPATQPDTSSTPQ